MSYTVVSNQKISHHTSKYPAHYGKAFQNCEFSNFIRIRFENCTLVDCTFRPSTEGHLHFYSSYVEGCDFSNCELTLSVSRTVLKNNVYSNTVFHNLQFYRTTFQERNYLGSSTIKYLDIIESINVPTYLDIMTFVPPRTGGFYAYKGVLIPKEGEFQNAVAKLWIPPQAKRSSACTRKCRASEALPVSIKDAEGNNYSEAASWYNRSFRYFVGTPVFPNNWKEDRWDECAGGIHYFLTEKEAWDWLND